MSAEVFVDTNIWLYSLVQNQDDDRHQQAADFILRLARPVINSQVIREICSNLIKKACIPEERLRILIQGWYDDCDVIPSNAGQHLLASRLRKNYLFSYF